MEKGEKTVTEATWDWKEILDSINNHVVITDGNGIVLYANEAVDEMYASRQDIIGRSVDELERDKIFNPSISKIVLQTQARQSLIQETLSGIKLLVTASPIFDENGDVRFVVSYSHDVTELMHLREYANIMEEKVKKVQSELLELKSREKDGIIASSSEMKRALASAQRIAEVDAAVLLTGESGVGKNLIARFIHSHSKRKNGPIIEINCGSIPENLLESELFGYVAGSFSGASPQGKKGLVEAAEGGTLFLDEVGDLPLNLQVKLLTLSQEKKFFPIGSTKAKQVDFRLIAATNMDLSEAVRTGRFRQDLYFRLSVVPIYIPPLRERSEDLLQMIMKFIQRFNTMYFQDKRLSEQALDILLKYPWPGNVRELENMIERLVLTVENQVIRAEDLPPEISVQSTAAAVEGKTLREMLDEFEGSLIRRVYEKYPSTVKLAEYLGISQPTAVRKLKKYKMG
ncbi:sigma 54-interacting transcriptional regulator [Paradesulfitobacterium aromaticivorans]